MMWKFVRIRGLWKRSIVSAAIMLMAGAGTNEAGTSIRFEGYKSGQGTPVGGIIASIADGPQDPWFGSYVYHYLDGWQHAPRVPFAQYTSLWTSGGHAATGTSAEGWNSLVNTEPGRYVFDIQGLEFSSNFYFSTSNGYSSSDPEFGHEDRFYSRMSTGPGDGTWQITDTTTSQVVAHGMISTTSYLDVFYDPLNYGLPAFDPYVLGTLTLTAADDGGVFYNELISRWNTPQLNASMLTEEPPYQAENLGAPLSEQWAIYGIEIVMAPAVIYVKEGATGTGTSWADAYGSLQEGLADATISGNDIWVAEGTYKPSVEVGGSGLRYQTFQMINGVAIYGGFANTDNPDLTDRDPDAYETILSGDLNGDDDTDGDNSENCYHLFYHPDGTNLDATAVLDGFIITKSKGDVWGSYHNDGGGMYNWGSSPTITNCVFTENIVEGMGGGMLNNESSSPEVINCTFSGNRAVDGGGMKNINSSSPTVINCTFNDNSALGSSGGGMHNSSSSSPEVTNCIFIGNSASSGGGGMYSMSFSSPEVINCTFTGNSASHSVGGGGMHHDYTDSNPIVTNCIIWGNTAPTFSEIYGPIPVTYSCVKGGYAGTGNIDSDPTFVDTNGADGIIGTGDDNLRLSPGSLCIDAGDNTAVTELNDLDGHPRKVDGDSDSTATVDMGAYEFDWLYAGDFAGGGDVNLRDFAVLTEYWQMDNPAIDIAPYREPDGVIDIKELLVLIKNWLEDTTP